MSVISHIKTMNMNRIAYIFAVHKAPKYGAKVPANTNTPYRISFVEIIG